MLKKIRYLAKDSVNYRPHTEILFYNEATKLEFSTIALIDSGSDLIVVPYSIGSAIGLDPLGEEEQLQSVDGIGGRITYVQRECIMALSNSDNTKWLCFKNEVHWLHPSYDTINKLKHLENVYEWCQDSMLLPEEKEYKPIIESVLAETTQEHNNIMGLFNSETLLGRPFFRNLEYIQFCEKDRPWDGKVIYKVKTDKVSLQVDKQA